MTSPSPTFQFPRCLADFGDASAVLHAVDGHLPKVHLVAGQSACSWGGAIVVERGVRGGIVRVGVLRGG